MKPLALPAYDCKITEIDGKTTIYDPIRKKYLILTPEEWVRQHFIHLLVYHKGYAKSLIKVESGTRYGVLQKRTDILTYDKEGRPFLLVECKAPEVSINSKTLAQVSMYNKNIKAPYIVVTNGMKTYCFSINWENETSSQLKDIPMPN